MLSTSFTAKHCFDAWVHFLFVVSALLFFSCNPVRKMGKDAVLLNRNDIHSDHGVLKENIQPILKQKPNRRILGVLRFHLGVFNLFNRGKESKVKTWFKKTIGEEPVLLDSTLVTASRVQIRQYMENIGYFRAEVTDTIIRKGKHKANVHYTIHAGQPYHIRNVSLVAEDSTLKEIVMENQKSSLLVPGLVYSVEALQKERERIVNLLKNRGYFFFTQQYISYLVDSALNSNQVAVRLIIKNPAVAATDSAAAAAPVFHKPYSISNIYVRTDFNPQQSGAFADEDTLPYLGNYFITRTKYKNYKPASLSNHIFLQKGQRYELNHHENTYNSLADLNNFRFINIQFERDSLNDTTLHCLINLTPGMRQGYRIELEGTHNGGNFGAAVNLVYSNKNTFRGAELFDFRIKSSMEDQKQFSGSKDRFLLFNTYELGPEVSLSLPRLMFPFKKLESRYPSSSPFTNFTVSYNLQQRPEFFRRIATMAAGLSFRQNRIVSHLFYPAEINFVNVKPDPVFRQKLVDIGDPALIDSYDDHLITDGRYSLVVNTQQFNRLKSFFYMRFNLEAAGNSLRLMNELTGKVTVKDSSYSILQNNYAQYIKPDIDLRYYHVLNENNTLVYRFAAGIGIPYLNSRTLPFEKSFFAGGANDLRAFSARSVGPGSYFDEDNIQQSGEIKLNANIEYRFDIFRILQGAFFADAGNIWLTKTDSRRPGGEFEPSLFYKEIAMGAGVGFRFNFTYFVFRVDFGYKIRDPRQPENQRWVYKNLRLKDAVANFGIGYPF